MAQEPNESNFQWLEVRNFRGLEHVRLDGLGQVNLIVGKNNAGKTTLLEAIRFYATGGAPRALWEILVGRDEIVETPADESEVADPADSPLLALFRGRPDLAGATSEITVASNLGKLRASILWQPEWQPEGYSRSRAYNAGEVPVRRDGPQYPAFVVGGRANREYRLNIDVRRAARSPLREPPATLADACVFVGSNGIPPEVWAGMWDAIVLTDAEEDLIKSLRFLTPGIERMSLVGSGKHSLRIPMAKVSGFRQAVPFRSLGDGVNRTLGLLVALATIRGGGVLLVDEVENGIHYSVQDELWRLLIDAAMRFNVQVFATTHSSDCIRAFQRATAAVPGPATGVLTRLEQRKGKIIATQFSEEELGIADSARIEVR